MAIRIGVVGAGGRMGAVLGAAAQDVWERLR
jgi:dihydrodipicolinate reductase